MAVCATAFFPPHNMSANADAQVNLAASRPVLGRRLPLRYVALALHG
jgi:hypothetical protein